MIKLFNALIRYIVCRNFVKEALKEGQLHIHRDPVRKPKEEKECKPLEVS